MERHHPFHGGGAQMGTSFLLFFAVLITSCCFPRLSSAFTPATYIYLNCGSGDTASAPNDVRPFLADSSASNSFSLSSSSSAQVTDQNPSPRTSPLYQTARIFTGRSTYEFGVSTAGAHVLRLHFFPFSASNSNLFSAVFAVEALGRFQLLSNFSVPRSGALPVIKEYLLWVDAGKLDVTFIPSPAAFVSAIEVFTAPEELLRNSPANLSDQVGLETVHRINMGGPLIVPSNDTLWRTWVPDDAYLFSKALAMEVNTTDPVQYPRDGAGPTKEVAPERVYSTAQAMNTRNLQDPRFNITWQLSVSTGADHLVRMHFYNILPGAASDLYFNAYIDGDAVLKDLWPSLYTFGSFAVPFYKDFTREGGGSGGGGTRVMRVSVGWSEKSSPAKVNAILNGLEIMRIVKAGDGSGGGGGGSKKKFRYILIASVAGALALLALLATSLFLSARRRRRRPARRPPPERKETAPASWSPLTSGGGHSVTTVSKLSQDTVTASPRTPRVINLDLHISLDDIRAATNDFDEGLVIGSGGFGRVYKGALADGTRVAVKRGVRGLSHQGYPEFEREVMVLSKIRHRHLVSLIGYCDENAEMILVYEFMEKGPLKSLLYGGGGAEEAPCLTWKQRLEICIGAARGIHYLHTGYAQGIIHRDVKSSNILLGEDYVAKVSDFGLSRVGPSLGETHVSTGVKGSFGYLDPEYFKTQQLTDKSDVYSFGVVLFEVLCARPVLDPQLSREQLNLAEWAIVEHRRGRLEHIVDPRLRGVINPKSLRKFGETAVKCLAEYGVDRPTIGDVLWNLEYCLQLQQTELRREPHEDSGAIAAPLPVPVRRMPSSNVRMEGAAPSGVDEEQVEFTTSKVFSQLITHEGR